MVLIQPQNKTGLYEPRGHREGGGRGHRVQLSPRRLHIVNACQAVLGECSAFVPWFIVPAPWAWREEKCIQGFFVLSRTWTDMKFLFYIAKQAPRFTSRLFQHSLHWSRVMCQRSIVAVVAIYFITSYLCNSGFTAMSSWYLSRYDMKAPSVLIVKCWRLWQSWCMLDWSLFFCLRIGFSKTLILHLRGTVLFFSCKDENDKNLHLMITYRHRK